MESFLLYKEYKEFSLEVIKYEFQKSYNCHRIIDY